MSKFVFITPEETRRACTELGISDWSAKRDSAVDPREAEVIRRAVGGEALDIPLEDFRTGLEVELEHGSLNADANVTANHPLATGLIVLAHLKEGLDYYARLSCMELEMDLDSALAAGDLERARAKRRALASARARLETSVGERLAGAD